MEYNKKSLVELTFIMIIFFTLIGTSFATQNSSIKSENVSIKLLSDKTIYNVGDNINLFLNISNSYDTNISGELHGKIIIGDVGYEIQCFDYNAPANKSEILKLTPIPASMSNSNRKTMSTLYSCSGTTMQSTKTIVENTPIAQSGKESFKLGPFDYSYTFNGTDFDKKSNILNITVVAGNNTKTQNQNNQNSQSQQRTKQNSQSQQSKQSQQSQQSKQNSMNNANNKNQNNRISNKDKNSLTNNQQNSQTINQLKKEINNAKTNPLNTSPITEEKKDFWIWLLILLIIIVVGVYFYSKNHKSNNPDIIEEKAIEEKKTKRYIELLEQVKNESDEKEKAKLISQAIRSFIAERNNLKEDLTYKKALILAKNDFFIKTLMECERFEFENKKTSFDFNLIVKKLRGEFKNE